MLEDDGSEALDVLGVLLPLLVTIAQNDMLSTAHIAV